MARFYYKKYAAEPRYYKKNEKKTTKGWHSYARITKWNRYTDLMINEKTGYYLRYGTDLQTLKYSYSEGELTYVVEEPYRTLSYRAEAAESQDARRDYTYTITPEYAAGKYLGEVLANDKTYPDNGYDAETKAYYIKDRKRNDAYVMSGGKWKLAPNVRVLVNGVWKPAEPKL